MFFVYTESLFVLRFSDLIYFYDSHNYILVYLDVFMIIREAQNRPN